MQHSSKAETSILPAHHIEGLDGDITSASCMYFPVIVEHLTNIFVSKGTAGKAALTRASKMQQLGSAFICSD